MATDQHATTTPDAPTADHTTETEELGIDPRYDVVDGVDTGGGLHRIIDPFVDMVYPRNEDNDLPRGVIDTNSRWRARQHPDGSGIVQSGPNASTVYGIRTADGIIVANAWDSIWFPYRSDYHKRREDGVGEVFEYDYDWFIEVPFRFVGSVLTEQTSLDIGNPDSALRRGRGTGSDTFVDGTEFMREVAGADLLEDDTERGVLLTHTSGVQVYVGYDSTARGRGDGLFAFVPFDGTNGVPVPSASDALDLLRPNRVAAAGSDVERQGEWFLVPTVREADGTVQKPGLASKPYGGSPLESHVPRDWRPVVDDDTFARRFIRYTSGGFVGTEDTQGMPSPQECVDWVHDHESGFTDVTEVYADIREMAEGIQVRGTLRHRDNDHGMESTEEWRCATTHDWDVLTVDQSSASMAAMYE